MSASPELDNVLMVAVSISLVVFTVTVSLGLSLHTVERSVMVSEDNLISIIIIINLLTMIRES